MNIFALLSGLPLLLSGFFGSELRGSQKPILVYNENCQPKFQLETNGSEARLVERSSESVIETFPINQCPYRNPHFDAFVYVENEAYGYQHVGVAENLLFDLDREEPIDLEPLGCRATIHGALTEISYSDIPSNAIRCEYDYYFGRLSESSYGNNVIGTCTMVACQILFGYYDSTFLDQVVQESYDVPSYQSVSRCADFSFSPFTNPEPFHTYLCATAENYCNFHFCDGNGMTNLQQNHFINHYIGAIRNLPYQNNTSEGNVNDILSGRQFQVAREAIESGRPLIVNNLSHSMVGFAFDETYLYLMSGWRTKRIVKMKWDDYNGNIFDNYCAAYDLILTSRHSCPNNYHSTSLNRDLCPRCHG